MMSLFFEVEIKPGRTEQYLNLAASLKPALTELGGCLFLDPLQESYARQSHPLLPDLAG